MASKRVIDHAEARKISEAIGRHWRKLEPFLNLDQTFLRLFEQDGGDPDTVPPAYRLLLYWTQFHNDRATIGTLSKALRDSGLESVLRTLKP